MATSYDVRIYKTEVYRGSRKTSHYARWKVAGRQFRETFGTAALADSFRSQLVTATRKGEVFDTVTGRPPSMTTTGPEPTWLEFATRYVDMKWPSAAATYRRSIAEALTAITPPLVLARPGRPDDVAVRSVLTNWAFNAGRRGAEVPPDDVAAVLRWLERNTRTMTTLAEPAVLRLVLDRAARRLDGKPAAGSVLSKRRRVLFNVMEFATEQGVLTVNPIPALRWKPQKASVVVDRRSVVNPVQARTLLAAVRETKRSGPRLVAFFGLLYFAALRPEEAANVRLRNLDLPADGWGTIHLERATPYAGGRWTDDGRQREDRQLKNRPIGEGRSVPCPHELTTLLREHLAAFPPGPDGRLFRGEFSEELPKLTYMKAWRGARVLAFTPEVAAGPLARKPYDLRHACVSLWLKSGVPAPQVAEWAGHSVDVLLKVYAKCIDGQEEAARRRVMDALGARTRAARSCARTWTRREIAVTGRRHRRSSLSPA